MTVLLVISGVLLVIAAGLITYRVLAGPSSLDRLIGLDSLLAVAMCGLATWVVHSRDTTIVPAIGLGWLGWVMAGQDRDLQAKRLQDAREVIAHRDQRDLQPGLGGMAAREALNWLIWPAIAAAEIEPGEFTRQVEGIGQGTDVAIEVVCLAPPANPLGRRGEVRLGKIPVRTVPLDVPLVERLVLTG